MDESRRKFLPWFQAGSAAVALGALGYVFSRINIHELWRAFHSARLGWLVISVLAYGLVFPPSAWRWHLTLRLTGGAVHVGATVRMSLIGHLFYTLFFGVAGGDFAKSALYARWYQLPLPDVLAAAPLDRLLGFGGLILFTVLAFGLAWANGAFAELAPVALKFSPGWVALILVAGLLCWLLARRAGQKSAVMRMWRAFQDGGKRLLGSRSATWQGVGCGLLVQLALAGSLALSLQAVSHSPLPWGRLLWTFPVISIASALPFNVAGSGLREGVVLALLGLYGVGAADAVAAALLTLGARLFWAAMGGILLWREQRWQSLPRPVPRTISIIVFGEGGLLEETAQQLRAIPEVCEIILLNGMERGASKPARESSCNFLAWARACGQLQSVAEARGDVIVVLPAGATLPPEAGKAMVNCLRDTSVVGGGFRKIFYQDGRRLPILHPAQIVRVYLGFNFPTERVVFVRREVLIEATKTEGTENDVCGKLKKFGRLALADAVLSIRFTRR